MEQFWTFRSDGEVIVEVGIRGTYSPKGATLKLSNRSFTLRRTGMTCTSKDRERSIASFAVRGLLRIARGGERVGVPPAVTRLTLMLATYSALLCCAYWLRAIGADD